MSKHVRTNFHHIFPRSLIFLGMYLYKFCRMKNSKLKVGVIGVNAGKGWAATAHLPALKSNPAYEVVAIGQRNLEMATEAAKHFEVAQSFSDYRELLSMPGLDLAVVTVKVPLHRELVTSAIHAGVNVFSEWPLGKTLAEAEELNTLAKKAGVRGFIGLQSRSVPTILFLRDLIGEGGIGEVLSTSMIGSGIFYGASHNAASAYAVDASNGAGMINVTFANAIDALCFVLGEFSELSATLANRRKVTTIIESGEAIPMTAVDQVAVTGVLHSGAVASTHFRGGMSNATNFFWEINGTLGDITISAPGGHIGVFPLTVRIAKNGQSQPVELSIPAEYLKTAGDLSLPAQNVGQNYALIESDLRNDTHLAPDFADAITRQRMIDAIELAARTGCKQHYLPVRATAGG
jgi:predicted dehydrogenase